MQATYSGALLLALIATPALTNAQSIFSVVPTPNGHHGVANNALQSVAASSPSDIWAVGQTAIHYNGATWTAYPTPMINGDNTSYLDGVVDISPTDAWAAGITGIGTAAPNQIIEHWDGTAWSVFPGPTFSANQQPAIYAMTSTSANDIWAVGSLLVNNQTLYELFEHWDGSTWTATTGQFHGFFRAVSADASNDIWAVGYSNNVTFAEHYDGTRWTFFNTPNVGSGPNSLGGVLALAPNNVWAVGFSTATLKPPPPHYDVPTHTLIEHFDGNGWSIVASPNVGPNSQYQSNRLLGVTAVTPTDIWAFGSYFAASGSEYQITLLLHWDGTTWTLAPCPSPQPGDFMDNILFSGVSPAPGEVWIVGSLDPAAQGKPVTDTFVLHTTGG